MANSAPGRRTVFLIDGTNYLFRAFFAIRGLSNSRGFPTNAVFGFTNMLLKVLRDHAPDYVVMVFDAPGKTFRDDLYAEYKGHRPEIPEDLPPQIPVVRDLVRAFRIGQLEIEGYEADDVIGTLANRLRGEDVDAVIVTGDKDLLQLVGPGVSVLDTMKDVTYGRDEVIARFGVPPEQVVEVLGLAGDTTDNIPGVRGIGEKTAAELIRQFGDIESVLARVDEVKGEKRRDALREHADTARLSRRLATVRTDVPIDFRLENYAVREPDREALGKIFREMGFSRLLREFGEERKAISHDAYRPIFEEEDLRAFLAEARRTGVLSIDLETTSVDPMRAEIVGVALAHRPGEAVYVPVAHRGLGVPAQIPPRACLDLLRPCLEDGALPKAGQNLKYEWIVFRRAGIRMVGIRSDSMIASYLLDPSRMRHNLDELAQEHLEHRTITYADVAGTGKKQIPFGDVPIDRATTYACEDADVALRLVQKLEPQLEADGLGDLYRRIEIPLLTVLARMEMNGVFVDIELLGTLSRRFDEELQGIEARVHALAGEAFNLNSPRQLSQVLYERLRLPVWKRTPKGVPSTDTDVLERLASQHDLPREILRHRQLAKLKGTYVDTLPELIHPETGRIHTSYNQTVTATGRLSSSDPNLQNIPIRTPEGREIRRAFIPAPGHRLVSADYSQVELRILAHLSEDPTLIAAFERDEDIHRRTASEVFGVPPDQVTEEQRSRAKAVNFGLMYGQGAFGLSQQLGISTREAEEYIEGYFRHFSSVRLYFEKTLAQARRQGYVTTLMNRRRYLSEIGSDNRQVRSAAERMAVNTTIQGTAADLVKVAMLNVQARLDRENPQALLIMQVHDELVLETPAPDLDRVRVLVQEEMERVLPLRVPLKVDVRAGLNWSEAH